MPWFFPWSDFIKKRACRYLLQHYLGHFLQEKLTLDQLTVDLYNGTGRVDKVPLDVWSVNEMLDNAGIPVEIIDGFIGSISVSVPWTALLSESCCLDIQGLEVTITPRQRVDTGGSMTDSMIWNAMTTSMQLAQECLKEGPSSGEEQAEASPPFEGLESFAQTIESVLARVKLSFTDTVIRFEHLPKDTITGIGLQIHIRRIDYSDLSTELGERDSHYKAKSVYEPAACACKNLKIFGVSVHLDEFPEESRTMPQAPDFPQSPPPSPGSDSCSPPLHHSHSPLEGLSLSAEQFPTHPLSGSLLPPIKIATFAGHSEIKLKLKQNVAVPGPKVDVECFLGTLNVFLSPKQVHLLVELCGGFSSPDVSDQTTGKGHSVNKPMQSEDFQKIEQDLQNQLMSARQQDQRHQQGQQRVDSWNFNFDSTYGTNDVLSHDSSGVDYYNILGEEGEETFYSMSPSHDVLPPLEEPVLPADMFVVKSSGNLLQSPEFSALGTLGGGHSSPYNLMNTIGCDKRFMRQKVQIPGASLAEAANTVFVSAKQSMSSVPDMRTDAPQSTVSRHSMSSANPGLAGIAALDDPCPDVTKISIKLTSLAMTVLHIDPVLSPSSEIQDFHSSDSHPLSLMADKFFSSLGTYGFGGKDFEGMAEKFALACCADHLRCMAAPISFEFERTVSSSHQTGNIELSIGKLELNEYLFERLSTSSPTPTPYSITQNQQALFTQAIEDTLTVEQPFNIHLSCPSLTLVLRFPIPDLRPAVDRRPWWKQSLRKECLIFDFSAVEFNTSLTGSELPCHYNLSFKELHGL